MTRDCCAFSPGRRVTPGATRQDGTDLFTALIRRYERPIFAAIYRMMDSDAADAADLTQDTFLKAQRALPGTSDDLDAGAWLHRIARNCCYDAMRRRGRIRWQPLDDAVGNAASGGDVGDPEGIIMRQEADAAVRAIVARLSPRNRRALVLRTCDGLSYREVGAAMGVTEGAARAQLVRARAAFRRVAAMAAHDPADDC